MIIKCSEEVRIFPLELAVARLALRMAARRGMFYPQSNVWLQDFKDAAEVLLDLHYQGSFVGHWRYVVGRN